jgi:protein TonB
MRPTDGAQSGASSPQSPSPARAAVDVTAITSRDDFLLELGQALGGQASVNPVESLEPALERLGNPKRLHVLVIDSRDIADLRADVDIALSRAPHATVLVFAAEGAEQSTAALLKGSSVFAVLALPIDERKTASVFEGAVTDCRTRQTPAAPASAAPRTAESPAQVLTPQPMPDLRGYRPDDGGSGGGGSEGKGKLGVMVGAGVALVVLVSAGAWYFLSSDSAPKRPAPEQPQAQAAQAATPAEAALPSVETSLVQGKVDELLEKARLAMRERRYSEPTGDNALLYYRSAMAAEPGNGEALDGLTRVAGVLAGRFDEALNDNRYDEAATALAQLKGAIPTDSRLPDMQQRLFAAQIAKALSDENPERAAAVMRAAQQSNVSTPAQLAKWRTDITRLQDQAREKRASELAARESAAAEQKKAREARAAAAAAEAEQQAQAAREQQAKLEQLKAEQAQKTAPAANAANAAAGESTDARVLQSRLKRKRYVAPDYPQEAMARRIGGVVTVAFTVAANGETRDVRVESADPPKVFDRAAVAAVKRWRYEPLLVDGAPTEVPVRLAIRFAPQE